MSITTSKHKFTKPHSKMILKILQENRMISQFYDALNIKLDSMDTSVRDMITYMESKTKLNMNEINYSDRKRLTNLFLINMMETCLAKGISKICKIYEFTSHDIELMIPEHFAQYDSFLVFGCPASTDIDVVCFVRAQDCLEGITKELSDESIKKLSVQLSELGYDTVKREIDMTTIYVDPSTQNITSSSKGGRETQNILIQTWMNHKQIMDPIMGMPLALLMHPVRMIEFTTDEIFDKLRSMAKYVLDYSEEISHNYQIFRPIKTILYTQGGNHMMIFMRKIQEYICYDPSQIKHYGLNMTKYHNRFKSIIMKLIQISLLCKFNLTIYVKEDLAQAVGMLFTADDLIDTDYKTSSDDLIQGAQWFLFRGTRGKFCADLFIRLLEQYNQIVDEFLLRLDIKPTIFETSDIYTLQEKHHIIKSFDQKMLEIFMNSPQIFTSEFENLWYQKNGTSIDISSKFIMCCSDETEFYQTYAKANSQILDVFHQCLIFVDQRSTEWLDMLNHKFICGSNGGEINHRTFQGRYNLIRGSAIEILAGYLFDPFVHAGISGFKKWELGFIVDHNTLGSAGFAPDMILITESTTDMEFILVEIKGLKSGRKNADYFRGLQLASKQIHSGKNILGKYISQDKLKINRGLILLCYIENQKFMMECHWQDL